MGNLSVEYKVANEVVLTDEGRGIFTEIVEDLHYLVRFHHFFEPVVERIYSLQINYEAFVRVIYLY